MKNSSLILFVIAVAPAICIARALPPAQELPPAPPPPPVQTTSASSSAPARAGSSSDVLWARVQRIANGQEVLVTNTYGPPLRCRFEGVTDAYLFCDPPGSPVGTGYQFDRASVLDVRVMREPHNWHPGLLSAMVGGGLIVGIAATGQTDAGHAAQAGLIGALVTGAIAAPLAFLQPQDRYAGVGAGFSFHPHGFHGWHRFRPTPASIPRR
jgi:hypothetical protein